MIPEPTPVGADPVAELREAVRAATEEMAPGPLRSATFERPPRPELGDYSTNAPMLLAPLVSEPPREVAQRLRDRVAERLSDAVERIEVAGPGFLNLFLTDRWYREAVRAVLVAGEGFAAEQPGSRESVLLEFVSANPTGPLTVASGRGAAYGDSLARLLERRGHHVSREYYLNDTGTQMRRFAESIAARITGDEPPEDGYEGDYVRELADDLRSQGVDASDIDGLARLGEEKMRARIEATLERFRVRFDRWFSERSLHESGELESVLSELRAAGHVYESEGALWLRTSGFGDDKDRVLVRSQGEPTYFASDIAYHRDKLRRAERLIDPLGADHHGYVPRLRAAVEALGADADRFEAPVMQLVQVVEGGSRARMSKRKGEFVTLDDLIDDIGVDAARFFMAQRSHDTPLDIDLELARRESADNPVYYVQYAHARIASILRKAATEHGWDVAELDAVASGADGLDSPAEPSERELAKRLFALPEELCSAAEQRAPHRLCAYASATAADFHAFYRDCKVVGAQPGVEEARLGMCLAAKSVLATTLGLLGVAAPERM